MTSERSEEEVDEQKGLALDRMDSGTQYHSLSYEQGVVDTIDWLRGVSNDPPIDEMSDGSDED